VVLRIHPDDVATALALGAPAIRREEALLPWLARRERGPAVRPLAVSAPPSAAELVFLERRVARPIAAAPRLPASDTSLAVAARMAGLVDHELWDIRTCGATPCLALAEANRPADTGWATLVARPGDGAVIEAPHPREEPGTGRLAAELWAAGEGRALIVGGGGGAYAPLQAIHQAVLPEGGPVVQVRGRGEVGSGGSAEGEEELVIGLGQVALDPRPLPAALGWMLAPGGPLAWVPAWRLADGSAALAPLSGAGNAQLEFATGLAGETAAVLWFPARLRAGYAPHDPCPALVRAAAGGVGEGCALRDEAAALGLGDVPKDRVEGAGERSEAEFLTALGWVERFAEDGDLHVLRAAATAGWRLDAGVGRATGRGFVAVRGGQWHALVWLGPVGSGANGAAGPAADGGVTRDGRVRAARTAEAVWDALWVRGRSVVVGGEG
jgi:hypothetical protein